MKRVVFLGMLVGASSVYAWNAAGHQVVAEIALNHMTPSAVARFQVSNPILDKNKPPASFTDAAVWLDTLRDKQMKPFGAMHYVDLPIGSNQSLEGNALNGLMAYTGARQKLLLGEGDALEQTIALRILLHVTADLHQPLHAATRVTRAYPKGDLGGNKARLPRNKISRNLHTYWDRAGGFLVNHMPVHIRARMLEKSWPCDLDYADKDPVHWLAESHVIAEEKVYAYEQTSRKYLSDDYQNMVYMISQRRLAEAGCRLAAVLNEIDAYGFPMVG